MIHTINGATVSSVQHLDAMLDELEPHSAVALQVERDGKLRFVTFVVE